MNNKILKIVLSSAVFLWINLITGYAQFSWTCGLNGSQGPFMNGNCSDCPHLSPMFTSDTRFMPNANTATKYIAVNFILLHKDDGSGGFLESDATHRKYLEDLKNDLNARYSNLQATSQTIPSFCNDGLFSNSKVQFQINEVYINNTVYWDNANGSNCTASYICPNTTTWYLNPLDDIIHNDFTIPKGISRLEPSALLFSCYSFQ